MANRLAKGLYVYAIAPTDARLPEGLEDIQGLQCTALLAVVWNDLAAIVSPVDPAEVRPTAEQVLAHEAVVEGVRRASPSLPVRFGTVLADANAVVRVLAEQHGRLAADLSRIGDKIELGLTALWDEAPSEEAEDETPLLAKAGQGAGTRYLLERLSVHRRQAALERKAEALAREVDSALAPHALDHRSKILPSSRMPLRAAYLVDPAEVDGFRASFDALRRSQPTLHFLLSGPWPPYSFATPPEERGAEKRGQAEMPVDGAGRKHGG